MRGRGRRKEGKEDTNESTSFVVPASNGSLTIIPVSRTSLFSEWLIMYMWSEVARGPAVRSTEQGKEGSVTEKGVSQICASEE